MRSLRTTVSAFSLFLAVTLTSGLHAQEIQFTQVSAAIDGEKHELSAKEATRIERFLSHVFPTRSMRRLARSSDRPVTRRVSYTILHQDGKEYILAGFTARWHDAVNVLGLYRMEEGGPNQIWRSQPWDATYYGMGFSTATLGKRSLILFREGASDKSEFGLASIISFQDGPKGITLRDLTPTLPRLRAYTRFPFRPLYGQSIDLTMQSEPKPDIVLTASDGNYQSIGGEPIRPTTTWHLNRSRTRFERIAAPASSMTQLGK